MFRNKRFRISPELREYLVIAERSLIPITVVQVIRTILFPTMLDLFLLGLFIAIYALLYLEII